MEIIYQPLGDKFWFQGLSQYYKWSKTMKVGGLKHHGLKNHFDPRTYWVFKTLLLLICLFGHGWITRHWTLCHNISLGFATSTRRINGRMAQFRYCVWTLTVIVVLVSSLFYVCNLFHKWKMLGHDHLEF